MFGKSHISKKIFSFALTVIGAAFLTAGGARADAPSFVSSYALGQALSANEHVDLYSPTKDGTFNIASSYFSGTASGAAMPESEANFNADQQLYALLVDGRYDFNYDTPALSSPLHPYIAGGMGMATTGHIAGTSSLVPGNDGMVPLFRLGGGVAYRLDQQWDLSLDYKAGVAAISAGDQVFTGRGQQPVDLQTLNVGMHYAF